MIRRFLRDSAIYVVPSALGSAMTFLLFPFYAHHFTPREYGAFDLLMLAGMLVGWTVALEIYQGVGRYVAGEKDAALAQSYASTALWFAVGCYCLFAAAVELLSAPISHVVLGAGVEVSLLRIAVIWMLVTGILSIAQAQLRWQLRPVAWAIASVINAVATIGSSALLVFAAHLEVEGAILGQLIGAAMALGYVLIVTKGTFRLHFSPRRCREMLSYSVPLIPASVGLFLNMYADRLVIQHERSLYDVGLYGVAYRLAMIMSLLLAGFQGATTPLILARKDDLSTPRDLARILRIFSVLSLCLFAAVSLLATPALDLLAAPEYQPASSLVPFLVISVLFANMYVFAPGLVIAKKTLVSARLTAAGGLANLVLALLLVPRMGIIGAGIATAVSSVGWFVALMAASQRHYRAPHRWKRLLLGTSAVTAFVAVSLLALPSSRAEALKPGLLGIRILLTLVATGMSILIGLGRDDLQAFRRAADAFAARRRRNRAVPPQGTVGDGHTPPGRQKLPSNS